MNERMHVHSRPFHSPTTNNWIIEQVYLELRGMVDASAEIRKLEKQLGQVDTRIATLQKQMAVPGYEEKVGRRCV